MACPPEKFIWLRNAADIIAGPLSSSVRSLALACAIKGAREIAVIGHTGHLVCKTTSSKLVDLFRALGIERTALPDNITEYFGVFSSERQNVMKAADFIRRSPIIGPKIPVHGLMVDVATGKLEWIVNGYQTFETAAAPVQTLAALGGQELGALKNFAEFKIGEMKFPDTKIGEIAGAAASWGSQEIGKLEIPAPRPAQPSAPAAPQAPPAPPKIPLPQPIRPVPFVRKWKK